ncbi:hypothetical protein FDO65_02570 [Nakamurella flava]|uniref:Glycosyltransferase RgtA/B/C/D-like domain-containing protein n=1 Tax=Nakamurella flava TaxID=2576308 RepID=A0A4U6QJW4_9ACTN|nr:hypothetical protein [Nakamurella flava]TKV60601.1 hypothetical protein FDO65_02570 [Nakamurella flava]
MSGRTAPPDDLAPPSPTAAGSSPVRRAQPEVAAPFWLEFAALAVAVTLAVGGVVGLLLAVVGWFSTGLTLLLALPPTLLALVGLWRSLPRGSTTRAAHVAGAAAAVLAVGYLLFVAVTPSQNVVVARDPGSYAATARQLSAFGALEIDARGTAFAGIEGLRFSSAAVYDEPVDPQGPNAETATGVLDPQFNHLTAVALAVGFDVGGAPLLFRVPALIAGVGLLLVYAVAVRATRRPAVALLAPALLAGGLPLLYVARNTYSEPFALALLWAAILVLVIMARRPRVSLGLLGGLLMGALVSTRVDALAYLCLALPLAAVSVAAADPGGRRALLRAWGAAVAATVTVGLVGWWDLVERTGGYVTDLAGQIGLLRFALVASAVVSGAGLALWSGRPAVRAAAVRLRRPVARTAAVVVGATLLFGWLIRPLVQTTTSAIAYPAVIDLQAADGLPAEPYRNYAEHSLVWMSWYVGATALAAAIAAAVVVLWRVGHRTVAPALLAVLVLGLGAGAIYWYDPQITPDQLWASRRFVPAILPAVAVWATAGLALLLDALPARWSRGRGVVPRLTVGALVVALLAPVLVTSAPVRWHRVQAAHLDPVLQTCAALAPGDAVVVTDAYAEITLLQTLRSWCEVPVAGLGSWQRVQDLPALTDRVAANGYRLVLVSLLRDDLTSLTDDPTQVQSSIEVYDRWSAEPTLDHLPARYERIDEQLPFLAPFALHWWRVPFPR